jgi:HEAT repeat protein
MHPNATPEHIDKALKDSVARVREAAIYHPKATPEHIDRALKDEKSSVRYAASVAKRKREQAQ